MLRLKHLRNTEWTESNAHVTFFATTSLEIIVMYTQLTFFNHTSLIPSLFEKDWHCQSLIALQVRTNPTGPTLSIQLFQL